MEELTEIITWSQLDLHSKLVALLNIDGYYDHFLLWVSIHKTNNIKHAFIAWSLQLQKAIDEEFIPDVKSINNLLLVSHDPKLLVDMLCAEWTKCNATK